jgi:hypothetical protein
MASTHATGPLRPYFLRPLFSIGWRKPFGRPPTPNPLDTNLLVALLALRPCPQKQRSAAWRHPMSTASETQPTERTLTDREFEDLLQRTWELVHNQKQTHPLDPATESPSWT